VDRVARGALGGFGWRRAGAAGALLLAAPLLVRLYTTNPLLAWVPETVSVGLTAQSIVLEGNLGVQEYLPKLGPSADQDYALRWRGADLYSIEPVAVSLTFAPLFLAYRPQPASPWALTFNTVAAWVATTALVILGLWLLAITSIPRALLATGIVGLATCFRTITAAGLWQHTAGTLWLTLGLGLWSYATCRPSLYPLAGVALATATACRPILVPAALLVVVDAWRSGTPRGRWLTAAWVIGIGTLALYANWRLHGSLLGGRVAIVSGIARTHAVPAYFHFSLVHLAGLLAAPSRGLFIYSPILLFALPGLWCSFAATAPPPLRWISISAVLIFMLYGFIATWWGGWVFGPRYMADLLPFFGLWLALTPLPRRGRPLVAVLFVVALAWSVGVQQLGVAAYPCGWNESPKSVDQAPERLWDWRDTEIARCWAALSRRRGVP
jgi:hypothetical protein